MWPFRTKPRWDIRPRITTPLFLGTEPKIVFDVHDRTGAAVPWRGQMFARPSSYWTTMDTRDDAEALIAQRLRLEAQLEEERTNVPALR